jgi:multiple sugar transport system permease protein
MATITTLQGKGAQPTAAQQLRRSLARLAPRALAHLLLIGAGLFFLLPLLWLFSTSLKSNTQMYSYPPVWVPIPAYWSNYPDAINFMPIFVYLKNTLTICFFAVIGTTVSSTVVAYSFSRIPWPGRDVLFIVVLATMMIPYQVIMIPLYIIFHSLHWINTFFPLTVPAFFGDAFSIFLLRQFFLTIPMELSEAARVDGASHFSILTRVIAPLSIPALATVALFQFLGNWNDFQGPLIYLNSNDMFTLTLALGTFIGRFGTQWGMLMAASTMITLPIIILFFFTQRTFIQGITLTGLKG